MCRRDRPRSFGSRLIGLASLVASTQRSRSRGDQAAGDALRLAVGVRIGGVDGVDAGLARRGDDAAGLGLVGLVAEHHRAEPQLRDLEAARAERGGRVVVRHGVSHEEGAPGDGSRGASATKRSRSSRFSTLPIALRGSSSTRLEEGDALRLAERARWPTRAALRRRSRAPARGDDPGRRRLAPALGGHAGDRRVGDGGMLAQHRLEVARVEVEAAADDHVLAAVEQGEEAVVVEAADVAGADEALAGRRRTTRPRRVFSGWPW